MIEDLNAEGTWSQYSISLAGMLFVYILFNFVKILDFDGLKFKVLFFMLITLLNVVDRVWNDIV